MATTIILFIIVLSLLVFVHELGHFFVARKTGMRVDEFGLGFPPRMFSIKKKGTVYSINWIPLGGFVKIKGESGEHKDDADSFASKKPWQRFLVLIAGVTMNMVLAVILFSAGFMIGLPSVVHDDLPASARVHESEITILNVAKDSSASLAGVVSGDVIASIDGKVFEKDSGARDYLKTNGENGVEMIVQKEDESYETLSLVSEELLEIGTVGIGIGFVQTGVVSYPVHTAIVQGVVTTYQFTYEILKTFYELIKNLIVSGEAGAELSGPVGIAVMTGQVASMGFIYLLQFTALLSINLAIINILPIPALDGGRILFLLIEKVRGKAVNEKFEIVTHNLGFILLMLIIVVVTYKDFINFSDEIFGALKSLIGV
jgi:regulator of sigma E protease